MEGFPEFLRCRGCKKEMGYTMPFCLECEEQFAALRAERDVLRTACKAALKRVQGTHNGFDPNLSEAEDILDAALDACAGEEKRP